MLKVNRLSSATRVLCLGAGILFLLCGTWSKDANAFSFMKMKGLSCEYGANGWYQRSFLQGKASQGTYDITGLIVMPQKWDDESQRFEVSMKFDLIPGIKVSQHVVLDALPNDRRKYAIDGIVEFKNSIFSGNYGWNPLKSSPFLIYGDPINYDYRNVVLDYNASEGSPIPIRSADKAPLSLVLRHSSFPDTEIFVYKNVNNWVGGINIPFKIYGANSFIFHYLEISDSFNDTVISPRDIKTVNLSGERYIGKYLQFFGEVSGASFDPNLKDDIRPYTSLAWKTTITARVSGVNLNCQYMDIDKFYVAPEGFVRNLSFQNNWDYVSNPFSRTKFYYLYGMALNNRAGLQTEATYLVPPFISLFLHPASLSAGVETYKEKDPTSFRGKSMIGYDFIKYGLVCNVPFLIGKFSLIGNLGKVSRADDVSTLLDDETMDISKQDLSLKLEKNFAGLVTVTLQWLMMDKAKGKEEKIILANDNSVLNGSSAFDRSTSGVSVTASLILKSARFVFMFQDIVSKNSLDKNEDYNGQIGQFAYITYFN